MSNLYCPNCDHLIGRVDATPMKIDDTALLRAWLMTARWEGSEPPAALYSRFHAWAEKAGRDRMTQRRFSAALISAGSVWRKTNTGRVYSMP